MPTSYEIQNKPKSDKDKKKTTSKDMPGSGMAKSAAEAIEKRKAKRKELLNSL